MRCQWVTNELMKFNIYREILGEVTHEKLLLGLVYSYIYIYKYKFIFRKAHTYIARPVC